jgi:hypothetical protein
MAEIAGHILIGRPMAEVFDFVADTRNEPSFNPAMAGAELLTPLPIGQGTRFRARMGRASTQMLVELTEFDRPHRLGSRTTSSMMQTSGTLTFASDGDGTVMSWDWQVRPKGWMRMLGPLFEPLGNRMERRIWTSMKRYPENTAAKNTASAVPGTERAGGVAVVSSAVASVRRARNRCLLEEPGPFLRLDMGRLQRSFQGRTSCRRWPTSPIPGKSDQLQSYPGRKALVGAD